MRESRWERGEEERFKILERPNFENWFKNSRVEKNQIENEQREWWRKIEILEQIGKENKKFDNVSMVLEGDMNVQEK